MPTFVALEQGIQVTMTQYVFAAITSGATPQFYGAPFTLSNFANFSEYVSLFDQYRIDQIEVWLYPQVILQNGVSAEIASAVDLDDANTPTSINNVVSKQGSILTGTACGHYHRWKPHMALGAYSGSVFTSFANETASWIDSASTGVQHYGLKVATSTTTGTAIPYDLNVRIVASFRAPSIP
jgi:hypothetical protein